MSTNSVKNYLIKNVVKVLCNTVHEKFRPHLKRLHNSLGLFIELHAKVKMPSEEGREIHGAISTLDDHLTYSYSKLRNELIDELYLQGLFGEDLPDTMDPPGMFSGDDVGDDFKPDMAEVIKALLTFSALAKMPKEFDEYDECDEPIEISDYEVDTALRTIIEHLDYAYYPEFRKNLEVLWGF